MKCNNGIMEQIRIDKFKFNSLAQLSKNDLVKKLVKMMMNKMMNKERK